MDEQLEQIEGVVEDIIYENEDNGYVVFEISGGGVLTVVCGIVGELHAGESVVCRGRYENHATYGRQFHAQECETDMPKDLEAVYAFLASRSLPYIGARTADKIIDMFGAEALEVIANDPARLTKIPGISPDKADRIQQEFKRMFGMRELIAYLAQFEISPRKAMEVFKAFGVGAMQAIESNPYLLCGEPLQLDFRHADSIAQYYHMEGDCAQRLEAALLRTLRHNAGNGHTCLPRAQLLATASNFIHQLPEKLARLAAGRYTIEPRNLLRADAPAHNWHQVAMNDVVLFGNSRLHPMDYTVYCDGAFVSRYRSDGVIIATPTGSTAYSLSAGGPVLDACAAVMVLTPACAHSIHAVPLVFSASRTLTVVAEATNRDSVYASADSHSRCDLQPGESLTITTAVEQLGLITFDETEQFRAIETKLMRR